MVVAALGSWVRCISYFKINKINAIKDLQKQKKKNEIDKSKKE